MTDTDAPNGRAGFKIIAVATLIAGLGGYAVTTFAARGLGAEQYSVFAVFWGALYLIIGTLAGFQQEFSRAARPAPDRAVVRHWGRVTLVFAGGAALIVAALTTLVLGALASVIFPVQRWELVLPIVVGSLFYVVVATLTGVLYGMRSWWPLAVVIVGDVALRAIAFAVVLWGGGDVRALAWATVVPFPLIALLLAGLVVRSRTGYALDVDGRRLAVNVARTVAAGAGASLLVSGFTLLIGIVGGVGAYVGVVAYVLVLARAPLVVATMALQSYFVVVLRRRAERLRTVVVLCAVIGAAGVVGAAAAWVIGPWLVVMLAGPEFVVSPIVPAAFVLVSTFTGWLTVSGSAVLSAGRHSAYLWGWTLAAVVATCSLFISPGDLVLRVSVALTAGPLVGMIVHLVSLMGPAAEPEDARDS